MTSPVARDHSSRLRLKSLDRRPDRRKRWSRKGPFFSSEIEIAVKNVVSRRWERRKGPFFSSEIEILSVELQPHTFSRRKGAFFSSEIEIYTRTAIYTTKSKSQGSILLV